VDKEKCSLLFPFCSVKKAGFFLPEMELYDGYLLKTGKLSTNYPGIKSLDPINCGRVFNRMHTPYYYDEIFKILIMILSVK